jgi:hypothetical protein
MFEQKVTWLNKGRDIFLRHFAHLVVGPSYKILYVKHSSDTLSSGAQNPHGQFPATSICSVHRRTFKVQDEVASKLKQQGTESLKCLSTNL